jgi:hypothetical protein
VNTSNNNPSEEISTHQEEPMRRDKRIKIYESYNCLKKKLIFNSNMIIFYKLLASLAVIDLFTCSLAIPFSVFEIFIGNFQNDYFCKLFEFFRSFGIISSNFIIILIAMERHIVVYMEKDLNIKLFKYLFICSLFITLFLSFLLMLQVGAYHKLNDGSIYYSGVCMNSFLIFNKYIKKFLWLLMTLIIISGAIYISVVYTLIFIKTIRIKNRRELRNAFEIEILQNAVKNSVTSGPTKYGKKASCNVIEKLKLKENKKHSCLTRNFRLAIIILFVAFISYLSILPWCLTINNFINYNPFIHYSFLLNSFFNPLVYGLFNQNFRRIGLVLIELFFFSLCEKLRKMVQ